MKNGSKLFQILLQASEKAANVARACRENELFPYLIEEKSLEEKNPRFFHDFKTLADVLIQEIIKHDIGVEFPELPPSTKGEETNVFKNAADETIIVEVCSCSEDTANLLAKVMNDDGAAAEVLATEVHRDIPFSDVSTDAKEIPTDIEIDMNDIGIWIDPIDSTADYINALEMVDEKTGLHVCGLRCVCVLIGVYEKSTGAPIMGIINQPFYTYASTQWTGKCHWGVATRDITISSIISPINCDADKLILISQSESEEVKRKLLDKEFTLLNATGAGYKLLQVALGHVGAYVLSKPTTFKWDTCGPQAILASLGGNVIEYQEFIEHPTADDLPVSYLSTCVNVCNKSGLIAYRSPENLKNIRHAV